MTETDKQWLDGIDVASPCSADWDTMPGDDRCRFCEQCSLHVFDLSAMSQQSAERLVRERTASSDRLCVRFTRRADGTVLTRDCPVGLRARVRSQLRRAGTRAATMAAAVFAFFGCRSESAAAPTGNPTGITENADPETQLPPLQGEVILQGDLVAPDDHVLQGRIATPPKQETDKDG
ncbi:MAG: hypothetical protein NXI31_14800 [bacterium]|nr:hypothetical protein [bacterium]